MKAYISVFLMIFGGMTAVEGAEALKEEKVTFEGVKYRVVKMSPDRLEIAWKGADGKPFRSFDKVQAHYAAQKRKVTFMANAGIFEPGGIPTGIHVENGKVLNPLNLKPGKGNFFLKPNGVFAILRSKETRALVMEAGKYATYTRKFLDDRGKYPFRLAVQSGPMLLESTKIHPAFNRDSKSRLHRNGVGVDNKGQVVFAITEFHAGREGEVNLHGFARLFLHLGCQNALFLDGDLSKMVVNPKEKVDSNLFGAIFVITEPAE